jgi:hypothetical protein
MINFKEGNTVKIIKMTEDYKGKFKFGDTGVIERFQDRGHSFVALIGDNKNSCCWHDVDNIEITEDTSKPVTVTHEGNAHEIGQEYLFGNDSINLVYGRLLNICSQSIYPFESSNGSFYRYIVTLSSCKDQGTITHVPVDLIDGNAYMFDYKHASYIGIYTSPPHRFIQVDGWTLATYCSNIRPMTVESK